MATSRSTFWGWVIGISGILITCLTAYFASNQIILIWIFIGLTVIYFIAFVSFELHALIKKKKEKKQQKEIQELKNSLLSINPYLHQFETNSSHLLIDIKAPRNAFYKLTREVTCISKGANEYYYRHDPANKIRNFKHNVGIVTQSPVNMSSVNFIIRLDRPCHLNEKRVFISSCTMIDTYVAKNEFDKYTKMFGGPESGSYTIIFPLNKPPKSFYAEIFSLGSHLKGRNTNNVPIEQTNQDGRKQIFLEIDAYELKLGDTLNISWAW